MKGNKVSQSVSQSVSETVTDVTGKIQHTGLAVGAVAVRLFVPEHAEPTEV